MAGAEPTFHLMSSEPQRMDRFIMHVRSVLTRMTRTVRVAFIGGFVGAAVAIAIGHGALSPSTTTASTAGSSAVQAGDGDIGWN